MFAGGNTELSIAINNFFGKQGSFSGRGILWSNCLNAIKQKTYIGFGLQDEEFISYMIGNEFGSHNYYLDLAFQRGVIGLIMMSILLLSPVFVKNADLSHVHYILIGFCCAYLIMFLAEPFIGTEVLHVPIFYMTLTMTFLSSSKV